MYQQSEVGSCCGLAGMLQYEEAACSMRKLHAGSCMAVGAALLKLSTSQAQYVCAEAMV